MNTLKENIQKKPLKAKFCPYCGGTNISPTGLTSYVFREHIKCKTCRVYIEIQRDQYNDLPFNNEKE